MKTFLTALVLIFTSSLFSQTQDFARIGFKITAVAMNDAPERLLKLNFKEETFQSRFDLRPLFQEQTQQYSGPMIYEESRASVVRYETQEDYYKRVPSLNSKEIYAFGKDDNIKGVKNIAYKPAIRGNIADAYCTAIYAARSGN
ncbi:hypothetical protein EAX61_13010 [Dokdonia sinensis]|uniref:GLPGLI family protein n=1 Tax=Dokdonia sinensis TaxID=2479847 RepID=A0A3M0FYM1_9FLAO|nr:hypothetical protein [Dokdonia sinensis]RMB56977.1 hypothetical protein EAX61_13010 [Dokdonia sinensis]